MIPIRFHPEADAEMMLAAKYSKTLPVFLI